MKKYFQAPWGFKDLIITGASITVLFVIAGYILYLFGVYDKIEASKYKFLYTAVLFLVQWIIAILPLIVLTKIKYGFKFELFGFKKVGQAIPFGPFLVLANWLSFYYGNYLLDFYLRAVLKS